MQRWKKVVGFEDLYIVSDQGNVHSLGRSYASPGIKIPLSELPTIQQRHAHGVSQRQLAREYHVTAQAIAGIVKGKRKDGMTRRKSRPLKNSTDSDGYQVVGLSRNGRLVTKKVHRLVAEAFLPNTESKPEVHHKDGNKQNNNINNLQWVTIQEHYQLRMTSYQIAKGEENGNAKLNEKQVKDIRRRLAGGELQRILGEEYGVTQAMIGKIGSRKNWKHC